MPKTILILAANPKNTPQLRLDQEVREIENGLERAKKRDQFILKIKLATRAIDVRRAMLDYKPKIVHFCGHGSGKEGIVLEDESGKAKLVSTEALSGFFELFVDVECVVLNACYSQAQADAIARHIPYVIGMKKAIGDSAAIEFAVAFYDALGAGNSVEFAYKLACNAIKWAAFPEHHIPILKSKAHHKKPHCKTKGENQTIPNVPVQVPVAPITDQNNQYQILIEFIGKPLCALTSESIFWISKTERGTHIFKSSNIKQGIQFRIAQINSTVTEFLESSGYLYWMTLDRRINRLPVSGDGIETIVRFAGRWGPMVIDSQRLYWLEKEDSATGVTSTGGIMTTPINEVNVKNLLHQYKKESYTGQLMVDQANLYWVGDDIHRSIYRMPKAGGVECLISKHSSDDSLRFTSEYNCSLAQDENYIYAANRFYVKKALKCGGAPTTLARPYQIDPKLSVCQLEVDSRHLYLSGYQKIDNKAYGVIARIKKTGEPVEIVLTTSKIPNISWLKVRDGYLYFGGNLQSRVDDGWICMMPIPK